MELQNYCVLLYATLCVCTRHCYSKDDLIMNPVLSPQELGIHKVGHLKRIQQGIKDIKAKMSVLDKTATVL